MGAILDASHEAAALLEAVIASETSDFGQGTWNPDSEVCRFGPRAASTIYPAALRARAVPTGRIQRCCPALALTSEVVELLQDHPLLVELLLRTPTWSVRSIPPLAKLSQAVSSSRSKSLIRGSIPGGGFSTRKAEGMSMGRASVGVATVNIVSSRRTIPERLPVRLARGGTPSDSVHTVPGTRRPPHHRPDRSCLPVAGRAVGRSGAQ